MQQHLFSKTLKMRGFRYAPIDLLKEGVYLLTKVNNKHIEVCIFVCACMCLHEY